MILWLYYHIFLSNKFFNITNISGLATSCQMIDRSRWAKKEREVEFPHLKEFSWRILPVATSFPLACEGGDGGTTRRCGGDFAAQGGFSHSHLCRYYATTWYLRPGVPQSVDGTSLPSSSSLADALPSPPPPSLLLLPPSPTVIIIIYPRSQCQTPDDGACLWQVRCLSRDEFEGRDLLQLSVHRTHPSRYLVVFSEKKFRRIGTSLRLLLSQINRLSFARRHVPAAETRDTTRNRHDPVVGVVVVVVEEARSSKYEGIARQEGRRQTFWPLRGCRRLLVVGDDVDVYASR